MATTTRAVLRPLLLEAMGQAEYAALTASALGGASGATLIDTAQKGKGNDFCSGWWIVLPLGPSGSGSYEAREVDTFVASTGTFTPLSAFSAQVASGAAYELMRYPPVLYHTALNRAATLLAPYLNLPKRDETLVIDNLLLNPDMETFAASNFTNWTAYTSPTLTAETSRKWHGAQAAKVVGTDAGASAYLRQSLTVNIQEIRGKACILKMWAWASVANAVKLGVEFKATTLNTEDIHSGGQQWELLEIDATVPSDATEVTARLEVEGTKTGYFDAGFLAIDHIYRYTIPAAILKGPYILSEQQDVAHPDGLYQPFDLWHVEEDVDGRYILLDAARTAGRRLRIEGYGALSTLSAEAGTVEIGAPHTQLLVARAAQWLYDGALADAVGQPRADFAAEAERWARRVLELRLTPGLRSPRKAAQHAPRWASG